MKKGVVFSLEVIVATSILISIFAFMYIFNIENFSPYRRFEAINLAAKDSIEVASQIKVEDVIAQFPILQQQVQAGNVRTRDSVIEAIGTIWVQEDATTAGEITREVFDEIIPEALEYRLVIDGVDVYSSATSESDATEVSQSTKFVSGFKLGEKVKGFVARASLDKILAKTFSSFAYFGGFIGQGKIKVVIDDIPAGATIEALNLEMNIGNNFEPIIHEQD